MIQQTKKSPFFFCHFKINLHLCSALHFDKARLFANFCRWHFLCPMVFYSSDPRVEC